MADTAAARSLRRAPREKLAERKLARREIDGRLDRLAERNVAHVLDDADNLVIGRRQRRKRWRAGGGGGRARSRFSPSGPMPVAMMAMNRPTAGPAGKNRCANVSLTITTGLSADAVKGRERASGRQLRAERLEVALADAVHLRLRRVLGPRRRRLADRGRSDCAIRLRAAGSCSPPAACTPGCCRMASTMREWVSADHRPGILGARQLHRGRHDVVGVDACRRLHHPADRAHEQRGADQQRARQRHLAGDQHGVDAARAA